MEKRKKNKKANSQLLNSKRSQSHVEIILSFVIFIGFLLFVFMFINPFAKTKQPDYIIDNIQKAIIKNISAEIWKLSVVTNGSACYEFTESEYEGNYLEVDEGNGKFIIYFNNMFTTNAQNKGCSPLNYTLGTYSQEDMIINNSIRILKASYENNYGGLKLSLGITNDFLFSIKDFAGDELSGLTPEPKKIPLGIDVEAREIPIRVINNEGQIQELILNIKAW